MKTTDETEAYEVGYGRPPKSGQFKKGASGNPSGRPKKPIDGDAEWTRVLDSKITIVESGQRKVITKRLAYKKQLINKAVQGDFRASQVVMIAERGADLRAEEERQNLGGRENLTADDLSDAQLIAIIRASPRCQEVILATEGAPESKPNDPSEAKE